MTKELSIGERIMAIAEILLCDRCLAIFDPYTTLIEEFCPRCQTKMLHDYPVLMAEKFPTETDPDVPNPLPEDESEEDE
jgi:predicted amidophosphoribosyltransferase